MTAPNPPTVRRSTLILPVHVERFVRRAAERGADVVMLDLEDSVAPSAKAEARAAVRDAIPIVGSRGSVVTVRINHDTWREDLDASIWPGVAGITFPKAESADEVRAVAEHVSRLEAERGIAPGAISISAGIETLQGLAHAAEIAEASERVSGVGGPAPVDFATDMGVELDASMDQLEPARGELDLLGRSRGRRGGGRWRSGQTITEYGDEDRRLAATNASRRDGARGSSGIHPSVVGSFNSGFTPTSDEVVEAEAVLAALEAAATEGRGWAVVADRRVSWRHAEAVRDYVAYAQACRDADARKARGEPDGLPA